MSAPPRVVGDATVSPDGIYRYELRRWWAPGEVARFIMLNPSTADATVDDPTIRRCVGFARSWGYGSLVVHNLYALRATDPAALAAHPDPVGPDNDDHLRGWSLGTVPTLTVCAWGAHRMAGHRAGDVLALLRAAGHVPHHLGLTAAGAPRHPLYLPGATTPAPFAEEATTMPTTSTAARCAGGGCAQPGCPDCNPPQDVREQTAASIAARIDWDPTCLPGQTERTIVAQVLHLAALEQRPTPEAYAAATRALDVWHQRRRSALRLLADWETADSLGTVKEWAERIRGLLADPVPPAPACQVCGCTDADCSGCIAATGAPCHWDAPGLCSRCAGGTR